MCTPNNPLDYENADLIMRIIVNREAISRKQDESREEWAHRLVDSSGLSASKLLMWIAVGSQTLFVPR